jgi:ATP-dependent Lhr-like helicase
MSRRDRYGEGLERVGQWMQLRGWSPFGFQREAWKAYLAGCHGMIDAATGTGKTLAAWIGPLVEAMADPQPTEGGCRLLWITPMRALATDTEASLREAMEGLQVPWRLERRTSDSPQTLKNKQLRQLPDALITTPESLSLLLTHADVLPQLATTRCVVVDEWHELMGSKRGVQTELVLARLGQLNPNLRAWGISATLGNPQEAARRLIGTAPRIPLVEIQGGQRKKLHLDSIIPKQIERFPWAGHLGTRLAGGVVEAIEGASSTLVFTNTRAQSEIWYRALLQARPDWAGLIAIHHGSLDRQVRQWVEQHLRQGALRAVVCTSSLDLGVDFSAVDLVVQVGSPKGIGRLLQRAGRSGHQPDGKSRMVFVPTHAMELAELAAARDAVDAEEIESRIPPAMPLDLLAQHVVTVAIGGGFTRDGLLDEIRSTAAYQEITQQQWDWVIDHVTTGGALHAYPEFRRVICEEDRFVVRDRRVIAQHRMAIGTIVSDASIQVQWMKGGTLGTVEESFIARLKPGDKFAFAGKVLELVMVRENRAYVKRSKGQPDAIPRWMGGRLPLSAELSGRLRRRLDEAARGIYRGEEMQALRPMLLLQQSWSHLPTIDQWLIETTIAKDGFYCFLYPFAGRLAHEGLAALLGYRLSRLRPISLSMACNEYGLLLHSDQVWEIDRALAQGWLETQRLEDDILGSLQVSELARRHFREIARTSGLVHPGAPGRPKTMRQQQASSQLIYDVYQRYDPTNLLMEQARREVLQLQLDATRLRQVVESWRGLELVVRPTRSFTPLAFPLVIDRLRDRVSSETLEGRIRRMQQQLERLAGDTEASPLALEGTTKTEGRKRGG